MKNRRALLLSSLMLRGYGVSVVAHEIAKRSSQYGWDIYIGCLSFDESFSSDFIIQVDTDPAEVLKQCESLQIDVVIAQTTPYFELLPALTSSIPTIAFEHGDPSPSFFAEDAEERENIRRNKILNVYPVISKVLSSSYFLRHDIEWPSANVIWLGSDHVHHFGEKTAPVTSDDHSKNLSVGTLMRLGSGEARYKGVELFERLIEELHGEPGINFSIMGRGTEEDGERWRSKGVTTHLNATDEERSQYLRNLDIFISPSLWEGFNLPLVEAQASGTVGIAFDTGAHPETTPFLLTSIQDAVSLIKTWSDNRDQLLKASGISYEFVRAKFKWETTASQFAHVLDEVIEERLPKVDLQMVASRTVWQRAVGLVSRVGLRKAIPIATRRILNRISRTF